MSHTVTTIPGSDLLVLTAVIEPRQRLSLEQLLETQTSEEEWRPLTRHEARALYPGGPDGNSWNAARWTEDQIVPFRWVLSETTADCRRGLRFIAANDRVTGQEVADVAGYANGANGWGSVLGHLSTSCVRARHRPLWEVDNSTRPKRFY